MANSQAPYGLRLIDSEGTEIRVRRYPKAASIIADGDPVKQTAAGNVDLAAAGDQLLGVAVEYKAAADTTIAVCDDPNAVFEIQASSNVQATQVFLNANVLAASPDASLKRSKFSLDASSVGTGSTLQLKIIGLSNGSLNNAYGSYAALKVKINNDWLHAGTTGV